MGRRERLRGADMGPQLPTSALPASARQYTDLPLAVHTEQARQYHLRTYERWCAERGFEPWPAELEKLLEIAADRGRTKAHSTVWGLVRVVAAQERARSGRELLGALAMYQLLKGILRDNPPNPVRPITPTERDRLFAHEPRTRSQRRTRSVLLLTYAAGFGIFEHIALQIEMLEFVDEGLIIRGLSPSRPCLFVGRGTNEQLCPVSGIRDAAYGRTSGPLWTSPRTRSDSGQMSYSGSATEIRRYGELVDIKPLSNERVRLAGVLEQARTVHPVQLAHFHGRSSSRSFDHRFPKATPTPW